MRRSLPRAATVIAVIAVVVVAALYCIPPSDKHGFLLTTLDERAAHLTSAEREMVAAALVAAEGRTGVDALLLAALAEQESHFRPRARGRRGALGLLQVRPATAGAYAAEAGVAWTGSEQLFDPRHNALIAATYLDALRAEFGSLDLALTAYNRGPTSARRRAARNPSSLYAASVMRRYETLRAAFEE